MFHHVGSRDLKNLAPTRDGVGIHRNQAGAAQDPLTDDRRQLTAELRGGAPGHVALSDVDGSAAADLHRGWMSLADALTGDNRYAVLAVAEQGEDGAKQSYDCLLYTSPSPRDS